MEPISHLEIVEKSEDKDFNNKLQPKVESQETVIYLDVIECAEALFLSLREPV